MKSINRIAMEFWSGVGCLEALQAWIDNEVATNFDPPREIYGCKVESYEEAENASYFFANFMNGFTPHSDEGELLAIEILTEHCKKLIEKKVSADDFLKLVRVYDANFIARDWDSKINFPDWQGKLYNFSDTWGQPFDEEFLPELVGEVRKVYASNKNWLEKLASNQ